MPDSILLINAEGPDHRVALLENGQLSELYVERPHERGLTGNIYKGRVLRVLPGMQAAFVDIGIEKAAFLHVADLSDAQPARGAGFFGEEADEAFEAELAEEVLGEDANETRIEELLKEGAELLVQVSKDPMGTKGARVTTFISLPGRHVVFMPTVSHIGVSRRIVDEAERKRLRDLVDELRGKTEGFIIRTAAEGQPAPKLQMDMEFLSKLWAQIQEATGKARAPTLLHTDLDLILRCVRDLVTSEVETCLVDDRQEYERVRQFIERFMPRHLGHLKLYVLEEPLFDHFGVEAEIDRVLDRKVWLKSGGYLVIDQAEALTAIDVNTGRYVGRRNLEDTITRINLEAVREIATQLRLRNLGGIIIIDFIDMEKDANRQKVWRALVDALRADRARSNVGRISELCLVEMTRKRTRESLGRTLTQPCTYCDGKGYLKSPPTLCYEILRQIRREHGPGRPRDVQVFCHPAVAEAMAQGEAEHVASLEQRLGVSVHVHAERSFHLEQYELRQLGSSETTR
ncbi:MAG: Rne/Rng family ribonuclease [Polyangia bacterium]|jgi:ribonuclease G|nr:Rne/Rng family ribonuclease [Polyangia bacterium]